VAVETKIEWTDSTFNPWIGCTRVSPACDACYAAVSTPARAMHIEWGPGKPRHRTSISTWRQPLAWEREHAEFFAVHGHRRRVFCASLADVFDNEVDPQWRADLLRLMRQCKHLDFLLLTKRIGNVVHMIDECAEMEHGDGWQSMWTQGVPPENVWLGITVCNQQEADRDIPKLLATPARVRFLSCEPMRGPIDLGINLGGIRLTDESRWQGSLPLIDWVIAGGESGLKARASHPDWFRSLRDQCVSANVPFHFKQHGEYVEYCRYHSYSKYADQCGWITRQIGDCESRRAALVNADGTPLVHGGPSNKVFPIAHMQRVGKKAAGRTLDGRVWDQFPEVLQR
jgi:protein gp37